MHMRRNVMPPTPDQFPTDRMNNVRADLSALQDLLEQAVGGVRTFGKMYDIRMRLYDLVARTLAARPEENPHVRRFTQLLDTDFAEFCDAEPSVNALLPLRTLQDLKEEMRRIAAFPALYSRCIVAVGGGMSCGKAAFVNSLLKTSGIRLAEGGESDAPIIPRSIIATPEQEAPVIRGVSCRGGVFDIPLDVYRNLSADILKTFSFDLRDIIRDITVATPAPDELFRHLGIMDTPVNAPESDGQQSRDAASEIVRKADLLIWLVDADAEEPLPEADIEFLSGMSFNHAHGKPLLIVAHKQHDDSCENVAGSLNEHEVRLDEMEGALSDAGLQYEGICVYSSAGEGSVLTFRKKNIHDFLKDHNLPVLFYYRFIVDLYDAFRPWTDAIRSDCDKREAHCAFIKKMLSGAETGASPAEPGDGLKNLLHYFQDSETRETRMNRVVDLRDKFSRCLKDFCDSLVAASDNERSPTPQKQDDADVCPPLCRGTSGTGDAAASYARGEQYRTGDGVPQSYARARKWYEKAAGQGNAAAMFELGDMYFNAQGVPRDYDTALQWYIKSADYGYIQGCETVGSLYESGRGVPQDAERARRWYGKAAAHWHEKAVGGDAEAACNLGILYERGQGVPQNYDKALEWYTRSAEQGCVRAQGIIGNLYERGDGVPQDYGKALEWYAKAAQNGHKDAMFCIGGMYYFGQGVPQDYAEALKWYERAAGQKYAGAQYMLGAMYEAGQGVPRNGARASFWYTQAAEQGLAEAQFDLAELYRDGNDVQKDVARACYWYKQAAEQGYARAQYRLAFQYRYGEGVPKNIARAVYWHRKAAEQGYAEAQCYLGEMYAHSRGVPYAPVRAVYWYKRAVKQGDPRAMYNLGSAYQYGVGVPKDPDKAHELFQKSAEMGDLGGQLALSGALQRFREAAGMGDQEDS